jgi:hypothetical protein
MTRLGYLRPLLAVPLVLVVAAASAGTGGVRTASADVLSRIDPRLRAHVSGTASLELGAAPRGAQAQTASAFFPVSETAARCRWATTSRSTRTA